MKRLFAVLLARIRRWLGCAPVDFAVGPSRTGLLFGYYGDGDTNLTETMGHVTLAWIFGWGSSDDNLASAIEHLREASSYGIKAVVLGITSVYLPEGEAWLRQYLQELSSKGLLRDVKALYPIDEPNAGDKKTAEQVVAVNQMVRRVAREFPELERVKLAVIYAGDIDERPGIGSYDWVGIDKYQAGDQIFIDGLYDDLKANLRQDQGIILVPGGVEPWKNDPAAFYNKAQEDHQVVAIAAFVWQDHVASNVGLGIRSNSTRARYVEAGTRIKSAA
jgi:hypothetical protein